MLDLHTLEDLSSLFESHELECKLAQGQNGQGEVKFYDALIINESTVRELSDETLKKIAYELIEPSPKHQRGLGAEGERARQAAPDGQADLAQAHVSA